MTDMRVHQVLNDMFEYHDVIGLEVCFREFWNASNTVYEIRIKSAKCQCKSLQHEQVYGILMDMFLEFTVNSFFSLANIAY